MCCDLEFLNTALAIHTSCIIKYIWCKPPVTQSPTKAKCLLTFAHATIFREWGKNLITPCSVQFSPFTVWSKIGGCSLRVWALEEFMNRLYKVIFLTKLLGLCFWWAILRSYVTLDLCDLKEKNCLPFGYSNNQFERPLTFKSSHTCKFWLCGCRAAWRLYLLRLLLATTPPYFLG